MTGQTLGEPLNIRQVINLLGLSSWSVRQRLIRRDCRTFDSGPSGKLIFYRHQVVRWVLAQQTLFIPLPGRDHAKNPNITDVDTIDNQEKNNAK